MFLAQALDTSRQRKSDTMSSIEKIFPDISGKRSKDRRLKIWADSCKEKCIFFAKRLPERHDGDCEMWQIFSPFTV